MNFPKDILDIKQSLYDQTILLHQTIFIFHLSDPKFYSYKLIQRNSIIQF